MTGLEHSSPTVLPGVRKAASPHLAPAAQRGAPLSAVAGPVSDLRAASDPVTVLRLQRIAGNRLVSSLVSPTRAPGIAPAARPHGDSVKGVLQRTLTFPIPAGTDRAQLWTALGTYIRSRNNNQDDPKIRLDEPRFFGSPSIKVDYTAQQLIDQYPRFTDYLNLHSAVIPMGDILADAEHSSGVPKELSTRYGSASEKSASAANERSHAALMQKALTTAQGFDYEKVDMGYRSRMRPRDYKGVLDASPDSVTGVLQILARPDEEGLVIGEYHPEPDNRQLLIDLVPQLTAVNVTTIYLEAMRSDYQALVDAYLEPNGQMSAELYRYLEPKAHGPANYLDVLAAIKNQGGLVVKGIDSLAATSRPYGGVSQDRDIARELAMNEFAKDEIARDAPRRNASKWVALVGRAHSNTKSRRTGNNVGLNVPVPGLSQMLDVPAVWAPGVSSGAPVLDADQRRKPVLDEEDKTLRT